MTSEQIIQIIGKNIYGNSDNSVQIVNKYISQVDIYDDNILQHPLCHESAHQALTNVTNKTREYLIKHRNRVEIFKIIWDDALKKNILNDLNYTDKYGYTALQRLLIELPKKVYEETDKLKKYCIDFDKIDQSLAFWIKANIVSKYKIDIPDKKKRLRFNPFDEDEQVFSCEYYGLVTNYTKDN